MRVPQTPTNFIFLYNVTPRVLHSTNPQYWRLVKDLVRNSIEDRPSEPCEVTVSNQAVVCIRFRRAEWAVEAHPKLDGENWRGQKLQAWLYELGSDGKMRPLAGPCNGPVGHEKDMIEGSISRMRDPPSFPKSVRNARSMSNRTKSFSTATWNPPKATWNAWTPYSVSRTQMLPQVPSHVFTYYTYSGYAVDGSAYGYPMLRNPSVQSAGSMTSSSSEPQTPSSCGSLSSSRQDSPESQFVQLMPAWNWNFSGVRPTQALDRAINSVTYRPRKANDSPVSSETFRDSRAQRRGPCIIDGSNIR